jgi:hypothetical protein
VLAAVGWCARAFAQSGARASACAYGVENPDRFQGPSSRWLRRQMDISGSTEFGLLRSTAFATSRAAPAGNSLPIASFAACSRHATERSGLGRSKGWQVGKWQADVVSELAGHLIDSRSRIVTDPQGRGGCLQPEESACSRRQNCLTARTAVLAGGGRPAPGYGQSLAAAETGLWRWIPGLRSAIRCRSLKVHLDSRGRRRRRSVNGRGGGISVH